MLVEAALVTDRDHTRHFKMTVDLRRIGSNSRSGLFNGFKYFLGLSHVSRCSSVFKVSFF